jgi:DNA-binding GntR family transcriptional regulator
VRKLVVSSATSEATSTLVDALARGEFRPGTRLTEESVAAQLGISRVPVREALSALVARTLLERRGRAIHVPTLDYDDLEQVYLARGALEDILYDRAADRIDEQRIRAITRLSQQIHKASETDSFDKINARNRAFHFTIMEAAELPLVTGILANLWDRTAFYRAFFALSTDNREKTQAEHEEIIDACQRRDRRALVAIHARHRRWLLDRNQPWLSHDGSGSVRTADTKVARSR